jgi:hypothetical protein
MARLVALLSLSFFAFACSDTSLKKKCASDDNCEKNFTCNVTSGVCQCKSDAACGDGEFCNGVTCQARIGCSTNLDCPPRTYCDRNTGRCLDEDRCNSDLHCSFGQICDTVSFQCVDGCYTAGDCQFGQVCRCPDEDASCAVGICEGNSCDDDSYCRYGERCVSENDKNICVRDERGPFCGSCAYTPGQVDSCGQGPNFCLLDRKVNYYHTYCGVDCNQGQECPNGYHCRDILILTRSLCKTDSECPAIGPTCATDDDCPGARCDATKGRCAGKCSYNEDSQSGFCTCTQDSDCPNDSCDVASGQCFITKRPCTPTGGECNRPIYCVQKSDRAACMIGKNCTPVDGLTCEAINDQWSKPN